MRRGMFYGGRFLRVCVTTQCFLVLAFSIQAKPALHYFFLQSPSFSPSSSLPRKDISEIQSKDTIEIHRLLDSAKVYRFISFDTAYAYARQALSLSNEINYDYGRAHATYLNAYILEWNGFANRSLQLYYDALSSAGGIRDTLLMLDILDRMIALFGEEKKGDERETYFSLAETLALASNKKEKLAFIIVGYSIYEPDLNKKLKSLRRALQLYEELGNDSRIALTLSFIGRVNANLGRFEDAEVYLTRALQIAEKSKDTRKIADCYYGIAEINRKRNAINKATEAYLKAISIYSTLPRITDKSNISYAYRELSKMWKEKNLPLALDYAHRSLDITKGTGDLSLQLESYELLVQLYERKEDFKTALSFQRIYTQVLDSSISIENQKTLSNSELRYITEAKDSEILLLQKEKKLADAQREQSLLERNILLLGILSSVLIGVTLWSRFRLKQKAETVLYQKNQALQEALHRTEIERKKSEEATLLKSEFLNIAAHDLKNPLQSISGFAHMLLDQSNRIDTSNLGSKILKSAERMLHIIDDLLIINSIESGEYELYKVPANIKLILSQIIEQNEPLATAKSQSIRLIPSGSPVSELIADVDIDRFKEIIDNLLSNAIKYSPMNTSIWVETGAHQEEVFVTIKDEGQGLLEGEKEIIFQKFAKISSRPTAGEQSTGLGLSIVKKLVEMHNGSIEVESAGRNLGTTFTIRLPLHPNTPFRYPLIQS